MDPICPELIIQETPLSSIHPPGSIVLRHLGERHQVRSRSWLDMPCSEPASLLPNIHISGIGPAFERIEIGKFDRENEAITVWLRPAKFDLAITVLAIYKERIAFPVSLCFMDLILFRFRSRVIFLKLAEVPSLNFIVGILLDLFLKLVLPVVIILERSPFPPSFKVSPGLDDPNVGNGQLM